MSWSLASHWSFEPSVVIGILLAALLYLRGIRVSVRLVGDGEWTLKRRLQTASFLAGLAVVLIALESPVDYLAGLLFSAHMVQHLLLIVVAAPLLIFGDPAMPLLRGVPLPLRRPFLRATMRRGWIHDVGSAVRWVTAPAPAVVLFVSDLYLWHWSVLYNLTLQNQMVHDIEHVCFLGTALIFWSQVIDQRPLHVRLNYAQRAVCVVLTGAANNILAIYIAFSRGPLYVAYAHLTHRPFGMTALNDQQLAGGIMWVPVLFVFGLAFSICLFNWLREDERLDARGRIPGPAPQYSLVSGPKEGSLTSLDRR